MKLMGVIAILLTLFILNNFSYLKSRLTDPLHKKAEYIDYFDVFNYFIVHNSDDEKNHIVFEDENKINRFKHTYGIFNEFDEKYFNDVNYFDKYDEYDENHNSNRSNSSQTFGQILEECDKMSFNNVNNFNKQNNAIVEESKEENQKYYHNTDDFEKYTSYNPLNIYRRMIDKINSICEELYEMLLETLLLLITFFGSIVLLFICKLL